MKRDYQFKVTGDATEIRAALNQLDGTIQTLVTRGAEVEVTWRAEAGTDPFEKIKGLLDEGKRAEGVLLLELFLSDDANSESVLYNLGMAYSDAGNFRQAVTLLRRLTQKDSAHTHGRIALGVALLRSKKIEEGIEELQTAVKDAPDNVWAQRNLGAGLLQANRFAEALPHLRQAQELEPDDQAARFGYGQALELNGNATEADEVYRQTIDLDEFSEIAELARKARSKIAEKTFHGATPATPRMDAVMYCVGALERFEKL
ncbi:MAG: tetratricopeptide repeat protein, partial [Chloroflexi bacterium]|nr:tetratricopeptide repeat protein [Chloroflexota bacterium]